MIRQRSPDRVLQTLTKNSERQVYVDLRCRAPFLERSKRKTIHPRVSPAIDTHLNPGRSIPVSGKMVQVTFTEGSATAEAFHITPSASFRDVLKSFDSKERSSCPSMRVGWNEGSNPLRLLNSSIAWVLRHICSCDVVLCPGPKAESVGEEGGYLLLAHSCAFDAIQEWSKSTVDIVNIVNIVIIINFHADKECSHFVRDLSERKRNLTTSSRGQGLQARRHEQGHPQVRRTLRTTHLCFGILGQEALTIHPEIAV